MSLKFLSMAEKPLMSKKEQKDSLKVKSAVVEFDPLQFRSLFAEKLPESQEKEQQLTAAGFPYQARALRAKLLQECVDEVCKTHGFKKIKNEHGAFHSNLIKNACDTYKFGNLVQNILTRIAIVPLLLMIVAVIFRSFTDNHSNWSLFYLSTFYLSLVVFAAATFCLIANGDIETNQVDKEDIRFSQKIISEEQMSAVVRAQSLDMFESIYIYSRLKTQNVAVGRYENSYYLIK